MFSSKHNPFSALSEGEQQQQLLQVAAAAAAAQAGPDVNLPDADEVDDQSIDIDIPDAGEQRLLSKDMDLRAAVIKAVHESAVVETLQKADAEALVDEDGEFPELETAVDIPGIPRALQDARKQSVVNKLYRKALSHAEEFEEDGNCLLAIAAARQVSENGKLFNDELVHKQYRRMDAPEDFRGGAQHNAHFRPSQRPFPAVVELGAFDHTFGDIDESGTKLKYAEHWLKVYFCTSGHQPALIFKVNLAEPKPKKKQDKKDQGKAKASADAAPEAEAMVEDTQGKVQERLAWVYIFGTNLDAKDGQPIRITHGEEDKLREKIFANTKLCDRAPGLRSINRDKRVSKIDLRILGSETRDIEGRLNKLVITGDVTAAEIKEWTTQVTEKGKESLSEAQLFLTCMAQSPQRIEVYFAINHANPAQAAPEHDRFGKYFTAAMWLTAALGNFWWARRQTKVNWLDPAFPWSVIEVPRWQVLTWPKQTLNEIERLIVGMKLGGDNDWASSNAPPPPKSWAPMDLTDAWPGTHEAIFCISWAVHRERMWQKTHIYHVFDRADNIEAVFVQRKSTPHMYYIKVYTGIDKYELALAMPSQRQTVRISLVNNSKMHWTGEVVASFDETIETGVDFYVFARGSSGVDLGSGKHNIIINFPDDDTTFARQNAAVQRLNQEQTNRNGYYLHNLVLGVAIPEYINARSFAAFMTPEQRVWFHNDLVSDKSRIKLDESQLAAALAVLNSLSGGQVIWGPPGTGKTATIIAIIRALILRDKKVLVTCPTNSGVVALVEAFNANVEKVDHRNFWTHYKGSMLKGDGFTQARADKVAENQSVQEDFWLDMLARLGQQNSASLEETSFARRRYEFALTASKQAAPAALVAQCKQYLHLGAGERIGHLSKDERNKIKELEGKIGSSFLKRAKVVFATCSMSADEILVESFKPDVIIIDEAGCATIPDACIPLVDYKQHAQMVILAGDPRQQPPVALSGSQNEAFQLLQSSLLKRQTDYKQQGMQKQDVLPVKLLNYQYRMHPDIIEFINKARYGGQIKNGVIAATPAGQPLSRREIIQFGVASFFRSVMGYTGFDRVRMRMAVSLQGAYSTKQENSTSLMNRLEAEFLLELVDLMFKFEWSIPGQDGSFSFDARDFMIVTPYTGQKGHLESVFHNRNAYNKERHPDLRRIEIVTAINAQGREARVVFISLTSSDAYDPCLIRWIAQKEQLTVELSRAQCMCITVGAIATWLQAIVDNNKRMHHSGQALFKSMLIDFYQRGDVIDAHNLLDMIRSGMPIARAQGSLPRRFDEGKDVFAARRSKQRNAQPKALIDGNSTANVPSAPDRSAAVQSAGQVFAFKDPNTGKVHTVERK